MKKTMVSLFLFLGLIFRAKMFLQKADKDVSFVDRQFELLQTEVKKKYSLEEIAATQSQVIDLNPVISHKDELFKLYIVSLWLKQAYHRQAFEVLENLKPNSDYRDLFAYYQATLFIEKNALNKAYQHIEKLAKAYPKDPDLIFKSRFLAQAQNYAGAIEVLNSNIKEKKKRGKTYLQRGLLHILIFDYDRSLDDLKKALRYLPKEDIYYRQMAYFQLGLIYLKNYGQNKKAEKYFTKGRSLDPQSQLAQELSQNLK